MNGNRKLVCALVIGCGSVLVAGGGLVGLAQDFEFCLGDFRTH